MLVQEGYSGIQREARIRETRAGWEFTQSKGNEIKHCPLVERQTRPKEAFQDLAKG